MDGDRLLRDLKLLARDAEDLVQATAGDLSDKARDARKRLSAALASAKATCEQLQDKTVAGAQAADRVVRDHPYQSIGVAFGVGLLLGVLAIRRNGN